MFIEAYEGLYVRTKDMMQRWIGQQACTFLERLLKNYPDANVILTVRGPDSWYRSVKNSIYIRYDATRHDPRFKDNAKVEMTGKMVLGGAFNNADQFEDEEAMKAKFMQNNDRVKEFCHRKIY